jgi:uncharacterized protein (TIGR03437 family)
MRLTRFGLLAGLILAQAYGQSTCVPFPAGFVPFSSINYVTTADAAGDLLVVGAPAEGALSTINADIPLPAFANQFFCDAQVQLAPQQFYPNVYVPTAAERSGDFNAFNGLLVSPFNGQPFANGVIPQTLLESVFAWRIASLRITNSPPSGTVRTAYNFQLTASGGSGAYSWNWFGSEGPGGGIPPGLTLSAGGIISGTPSQASTGGAFQVVVNVSDQVGDFGSATLTISIATCTPSLVTTSPLPADDVGIPYPHLQFQAMGCQTPYTFTGSSTFASGFGAFPAGLSLDSAGVVSGIPGPNTNGAYNIPITVTEAGGGTASGAFAMTINTLPIVTNSSPLPNGIVGAPYGPVTLAVSGGTLPYRSFTDSGLPPGLTLDTNGILSGTPTKAGAFTPTLGATDSVNASFPQMFQITIASATAQLQVSPASLTFNANANGDVPAAQAVSIVPTTNATPPFNFTIQIDGGQAGTPAPAWLSAKPSASGVAPAQLVVSANQGSMAAGSYAGRIRVIDSNGLENDVTVNLTVNANPQTLLVSPGVLNFSALEQSPTTLTANLAVHAGGGGTPLGFSTSVLGGSSWISSVSPNSGQTVPNSAALLTVVVNTSGLQVGSYRDEIEVSSSVGNVGVPVVLFVAESGSILAVNLTGVRLQAQQGGGFSNAQTVRILNLGELSSTVNWTAALVNPVSWLSLPATSGTATTAAPGSLTLTLTSSATEMPPGGYYALIKISDSNSRNSPQYVLAVLDLASNTSAPLPDPNPGGLFFVATAGGAQTSPQVVTINTSSASAVPFQAAAATSDGGTWLTVTPVSGTSSGASAGTVNVSVDPTGRSAGVYSGHVNVSMSGALRTVNVTLVVLPQGDAAAGSSLRSERPRAVSCAASKVVLTETALVNNFAIPAGWPVTLIVQLNDDCGDSLPSGSVVASFSNGDAPLTLVGNGPNGAYSATWQPGTTTAQMVVTLNGASGSLDPETVQLNGGVAANQSQPPALYPNGTGNNLNTVVGAPLAPGTIASVYGSGLGPPMGVSPGVIPLVNTFDNTYVLIGPYQAPLYYLSNGQVNIQIPAELDATQQYQIVASVNNAITLPDHLTIVPATPGVAAFSNGGIIAQHADYTLITAAKPAKPGEVIIMYLVGLGATSPSVPSGQPAPSTPPLAEVTLPVTVTVDNQKASVAFAGLTPGSAGLYQIDFQVPANASSGNLTVVVTQNGMTSNITTLPVSQ